MIKVKHDIVFFNYITNIISDNSKIFNKCDTIESKIFGILHIYKDKYNKKYIIKTVNLENFVIFDPKILIKYLNIVNNHKSMQQFISFNNIKNNQLEILYDYYDKSLTNVILEKKKGKQFFSHNEIYYIFNIILDILIFFEENNLYYFNIDTDSILINHDNKIILINPFFDNEFFKFCTQNYCINYQNYNLKDNINYVQIKLKNNFMQLLNLLNNLIILNKINYLYNIEIIFNIIKVNYNKTFFDIYYFIYEYFSSTDIISFIKLKDMLNNNHKIKNKTNINLTNKKYKIFD